MSEAGIRALGAAHDAIAQASLTDHRDGSLHLEQAHAITHAVDKLPVDKCPLEAQALVEKALISHAEDFNVVS